MIFEVPHQEIQLNLIYKCIHLLKLRYLVQGCRSIVFTPLPYILYSLKADLLFLHFTIISSVSDDANFSFIRFISRVKVFDISHHILCEQSQVRITRFCAKCNHYHIDITQFFIGDNISFRNFSKATESSVIARIELFCKTSSKSLSHYVY